MMDRLKLPEGWSSLFLLFIMLTSAALSISAARWTDGLGHLAMASTLALIMGLLLAKSRFPAPIVHLFSLVYGLFAVFYLIGQMVEQPTWRERVIELAERAVTWLTKATSGGTSRDSLMFVLLLAGLFWLLGHTAAWYTFRRPRLWRVLLPIGLTLLVNEYVYSDPRISTRSTVSLTPYALTFLLATILYTVRTNVYLREQRWQSAHVNYSPELRIDFLRAGAILGVVAVLIMALAPGARAAPHLGTFWEGIEDIRSNVRQTATRLFSSLDTRGRAIANPFADHMILGGPRSLGSEVLFDVVSSRGRYWRANVHDRYTGSDWYNTDEQKVVLPPNTLANTGNFQMRHEVTQTITSYLLNTTQLIAAPEPVRAPLFTTRANVSFEQGERTPASSLYSREELNPGDTYQIVSSVSQADLDTLRGADESYSDKTVQRYLQLPNTVTDRTRALAQEITADKETQFDKAEAIETYLRENLHYDLNAAAPPEGQDFVDFVLFDLQAGYCDYYASSFVVLARSVGIPARIAVGYAQGEYNEEIRAYRVRARNGHSWPEVFFPNYGWIQFEPTVIIDPIDWPTPPNSSNFAVNPNDLDPSRFDPLPDDRESMLADEPNMPPGAGFDIPNQGASGGISLVFLVLIGLLVLAGVGIVATYWSTEMRGMGGLSLIQRMYARLWRLAALLGVPNPPDQTPYERAQMLTTLVPEGQRPIKYITDMYVVEQFGQGRGNGNDSDAEENWSLLRPLLWKSWLQKKFSRFQQPSKARSWREFRETHYPKSIKKTKD